MLLTVLPLVSVPFEVSVKVLPSAETTDVPEATGWPPLVNLNERVLEAPSELRQWNLLRMAPFR
jgi:hypothetical protein